MAAIWALLVVTIVADKIAITDAVVPLVVVCLFYAVQARTPRWLAQTRTGARSAYPLRAKLVGC